MTTARRHAQETPAVQRPTRTAVRHGQPSCAHYGCTLPECLRAAHIARARSEADRASGITASVPAAPAAHRVQRLLRAGMSASDISARAGISPSTVSTLTRGTAIHIWRTTRDAILGIPVPVRPTVPAAPGYVDATGTRRRLRALAALGWPAPCIAARTGISLRSLGELRSGTRRRVSIRHHQAAARVYDELWNRRPEDHGIGAGSAARLRAHAARRGWLRPVELDDDLIDWPAA